MPLARYFLFVGGALLLVLLVTGAFLPALPAIERVEAQRAAIRIHSEMKLPERVVFDTSASAVTHHVATVIAEVAAPTPPSADDSSATTRQAFAQLQSSDLNRSKLSGPKRAELKPAHSRKSETKRRAAALRKVRLGIRSSIGSAAGCGGEHVRRCCTRGIEI